MKELSALIAVVIFLFALSAYGAARDNFAPDDMPDDRAIVKRISERVQQITEETPVSVQAERHGDYLDYTIQGNININQTLVLATWYDMNGKLIGVNRGNNGTVSV